MNTFISTEPLADQDDAEQSAHALMRITPRPAAVMARGAGSYLWDEAGNRYLDFLQGWAVNCLGHCPAEVTRALTQQSQQLITPSPALHNRPQLELAQRLIELSGFKDVHFACSGAEANEAAMKLARKWGRLHKQGAYKILSTQDAFHGRTLAMMAASGKPGWEALFPPYPAGFAQVPFDDLAAVGEAIDAMTVAIMVEPVQGEAGVVVPSATYLSGLRKLADEHDLLLIFDEVQTGIGRTGRMFGYEHAGIQPDVITLGKGLGGGVPLSAVMANERASVFDYGDQGGTFNGNPLTAAVGLAVLEVVAEPLFLHQVRQRELQLLEILAGFQRRYGLLEVRGQGLLYALRLSDANAELIRDNAMQQGLLINAARPDVLRFMPSLRVSEQELDEFARLLEPQLQLLY